MEKKIFRKDKISADDITWITGSGDLVRGTFMIIENKTVVHTGTEGTFLVPFEAPNKETNLEWFLENILLEDATTHIDICAKERFEADYKRMYFTSAYEQGGYEAWKRAIVTQLGGNISEKNLADVMGLEKTYENLLSNEFDSFEYGKTSDYLYAQKEYLPTEYSTDFNKYLIKRSLRSATATSKYRRQIENNVFGKFCYAYHYDKATNLFSNVGDSDIPYHTFYALANSHSVPFKLPKHSHEEYEPTKYIQWRISADNTAYGRVDPIAKKFFNNKYMITCIFSVDPGNATMVPPSIILLPNTSLDQNQNPNVRFLITSEYEQRLQNYVKISKNPSETGVFHGFKQFDYFRGVLEKKNLGSITSAFESPLISAVESNSEVVSIGGETLDKASVNEIPNDLPPDSKKLKRGDLFQDSNAEWILVSQVEEEVVKGFNVDPSSGERFMTETKSDYPGAVDSQDQNSLARKLNKWAEQENRWFSIQTKTKTKNKTTKTYGILRYVTSEVKLMIGIRETGKLHDTERVPILLGDFIFPQSKVTWEKNSNITEIINRIIKKMEPNKLYTYQRFINGGLRYQGHLYTDDDEYVEFITSNNQFIMSGSVDLDEDFNIMSYSLQKEPNQEAFLHALHRKILNLPFTTTKHTLKMYYITSAAMLNVINDTLESVVGKYEEMTVPTIDLFFPSSEKRDKDKEIYAYVKDTFAEPFRDSIPTKNILSYFLSLPKDDPIKLQLAESFNGTVVKLVKPDNEPGGRTDILTVINEKGDLVLQTTGTLFTDIKQISSIERGIPGVAIYNSKKLYRYDIPTSVREYKKKDFQHKSFPHMYYHYKKKDKVLVVKNGDFFDRREFIFTTVSKIHNVKNKPGLRLTLDNESSAYARSLVRLLPEAEKMVGNTKSKNTNYVYQTLISEATQAESKYSLSELKKFYAFNSAFEWKMLNGFVNSVSSSIISELQSPSSSETVRSTQSGAQKGDVIVSHGVEYIILKLVSENNFQVRKIAGGALSDSLEYIDGKYFLPAKTQGLKNKNVTDILKKFKGKFQFISYDGNLYYHMNQDKNNFEQTLHVNAKKSYEYKTKKVVFQKNESILFAELRLPDEESRIKGEWGFVSDIFKQTDLTKGVDWSDLSLDILNSISETILIRILHSPNTLLKAVFYPSQTLSVLYADTKIQANIVDGTAMVKGVYNVKLLSELDRSKLKLKESAEMKNLPEWFLWDNKKGKKYMYYHSKTGALFKKFEKNGTDNWTAVTLQPHWKFTVIETEVDINFVLTKELNSAMNKIVSQINIKSTNLPLPLLGIYIPRNTESVFGVFEKLRWDDSSSELYVTLKKQLFTGGNMVHEMLTKAQLLPKNFNVEQEYIVGENTAIYSRLQTLSDEKVTSYIHASFISIGTRIQELELMVRNVSKQTVYLISYNQSNITIETDLLFDIDAITLIPKRRLIHFKNSDYAQTVMEQDSKKTMFEIAHSLGDGGDQVLTMFFPYKDTIHNKGEHWINEYYKPEGNILQNLFPSRVQDRNVVIVISKLRIDPTDFSKSFVYGYEPLTKLVEKKIRIYNPSERTAIEFNTKKYEEARTLLGEKIADTKDVVESYVQYNLRLPVPVPEKNLYRRVQNKLYYLSKDSKRIETSSITSSNINLFITPKKNDLIKERYENLIVTDTQNNKTIITIGARRDGVFITSVSSNLPGIPFENAKITSDLLTLLKNKYSHTIDNWDWQFPYAHLAYADGSEVIISFIKKNNERKFPVQLFYISEDVADVLLVYKKESKDKKWEFKLFEPVQRQKMNESIEIGSSNNVLVNKMYEAMDEAFKLEESEVIYRMAWTDTEGYDFIAYRRGYRPDAVEGIIFGGPEGTEIDSKNVDTTDIREISEIYPPSDDDIGVITSDIPDELLNPPVLQKAPHEINAASLITDLKTYHPEHQLERFPTIGDPAGTMNNAILTLTFSGGNNNIFKPTFIGRKLSSQHALYDRSHASHEYFIIWREPNGELNANQPHFSNVIQMHQNSISSHGTVKMTVQVKSMKYSITAPYDVRRKIPNRNVFLETLISVSLLPFIHDRMKARIVLKPLTKNTLQLHYARFDIFYPFLL